MRRNISILIIPESNFVDLNAVACSVDCQQTLIEKKEGTIYHYQH